MLLRFWHWLFAHTWEERVSQVPADRESGRPARITTYLRVCRCGRTQIAQVMGDPVESAQEIDAIRKWAGLT